MYYGQYNNEQRINITFSTSLGKSLTGYVIQREWLFIEILSLLSETVIFIYSNLCVS